MKEAHRGDSGDHIELMKRLLIRAVKGTSVRLSLSIDGSFDEDTEIALKAFQRFRRMPDNGVCEALTWRALGLTIERRHALTLVGQPTTMSCWAAAASTILGNMMPTADPRLLGPNGGLIDDIDSVRRFGAQFGWRMPNHGLTSDEIVNLVFEKPIWIRAATHDFAHAVVLGGIAGDGSAFATMLTLLDPMPVNQGSTYATFLDHLMIHDAHGANVEASLDYVLIPN